MGRLSVNFMHGLYVFIICSFAFSYVYLNLPVRLPACLTVLACSDIRISWEVG